MKRIIIFTDKDGTESHYTTLPRLCEKSTYCDEHKYRIAHSLAMEGKYEAHGITVIRKNINE